MVICGQSLFLMAIEAAIVTLPGTDVVRIEKPTAGQLTALAPTLIVSERDTDEAVMRTLARCDLPFVELDTSASEVRLISTQRVEVKGLEELLRLIGRLTAGDDHADGV